MIRAWVKRTEREVLSELLWGEWQEEKALTEKEERERLARKIKNHHLGSFPGR